MLGLPYDELWPHQMQAYLDVSKSSKDVILLQAPTGSGKSAIAVAAARSLGSLKTVILTKNKSLQRQYAEQLGVFSAEGHASFTCAKLGCNAGEVDCNLVSCVKSKCEYYANRAWAGLAREVATNYSWFMYNDWVKPDFLVLDEAHLANEAVIDFARCRFTVAELNIMGGNLGDDEHYLLDHAATLLAKKIAAAPRSTYVSAIKRLSSLMRLYKRVNFARAIVAKGKYYVYRGSSFIIQPQEEAGLLEDFVLSRCPSGKKLLMSATILDPKIFMEEKGLGHIDYDYFELPNMIPLANRRVYYYPVTKVSYKSTDYAALAKMIRTLLDHHSDIKGIIHTANFDLTAKVEKLLGDTGRLIVQHQGDNRLTVIQNFVDDKTNKVLVSPSITTGVDFYDDIARFAIFAKVPFPNLGDSRVQNKQGVSGWYNWATVCEIVQGCGRVVRHDKDYGYSYIIDENFSWFYNQNKKLFPEWFRDALVGV